MPSEVAVRVFIKRGEAARARPPTVYAALINNSSKPVLSPMEIRSHCDTHERMGAARHAAHAPDVDGVLRLKMP